MNCAQNDVDWPLDVTDGEMELDSEKNVENDLMRSGNNGRADGERSIVSDVEKNVAVNGMMNDERKHAVRSGEKKQLLKKQGELKFGRRNT